MVSKNKRSGNNKDEKNRIKQIEHTKNNAIVPHLLSPIARGILANHNVYIQILSRIYLKHEGCWQQKKQ
jgi:hypothetical protein